MLQNFEPLSLQELYEIMLGKRELHTPAFHLTFDDGLREVFDIAAPILKQKGIPATIFLNSGFVDNRSLFFRYKVSVLLELLQSQNLTDRQLTELKKISGSATPVIPDLHKRFLTLSRQAT